MGNAHVLGAGHVTAINGVSGPVKIGGQNLLTNTNQGKTNWTIYSSNNVATLAEELENGINGIRVEHPSVPSNYSHVLYHLTREFLDTLQPNTEYVVSFDAKTNCTGYISIYLSNAVGGNALSSQARKDVTNNDGEWHKWAFAITTNDLSELNYDVELNIMLPLAVGHISIRNLKMERGNVPTDWSPAPEDILSRLKAIEAKLGITSDPPMIDGPEMEEMNMAENHVGGVQPLYS